MLSICADEFNMLSRIYTDRNTHRVVTHGPDFEGPKTIGGSCKHGDEKLEIGHAAFEGDTFESACSRWDAFAKLSTTVRISGEV